MRDLGMSQGVCSNDRPGSVLARVCSNQGPGCVPARVCSNE